MEAYLFSYPSPHRRLTGVAAFPQGPQLHSDRGHKDGDTKPNSNRCNPILFYLSFCTSAYGPLPPTLPSCPSVTSPIHPQVLSPVSHPHATVKSHRQDGCQYHQKVTLLRVFSSHDDIPRAINDQTFRTRSSAIIAMPSGRHDVRSFIAAKRAESLIMPCTQSRQLRQLRRPWIALYGPSPSISPDNGSRESSSPTATAICGFYFPIANS